MQVSDNSKILQQLDQKLTIDQKRQLLSEKTKNILKNPKCWDFNKMKVGEKEVQLFSNMKSANYVQELRFNSNRRPGIIRQISHVGFVSVTMLDVGSNKIASIEALSLAFMPNLQRLNLYNNQITSLRTLSKCVFKHLIYLSVTSNPTISDFQNLIKMKSTDFLWLWMQPRQKEVVMGQNLSWFMKLNWPKFTELMLKCKERLENDKINECISRKFPNLIIRKQ